MYRLKTRNHYYSLLGVSSFLKREYPNVLSTDVRVTSLDAADVGRDVRVNLMRASGMTEENLEALITNPDRGRMYNLVVFTTSRKHGGEFVYGLLAMHRRSCYVAPFYGQYPVYPLFIGTTKRRYVAKWKAQNLVEWITTSATIPGDGNRDRADQFPSVYSMESFNGRGRKISPKDVDPDTARCALFVETPHAVPSFTTMVNTPDPTPVFAAMADTPVWTLYYTPIGWTRLPMLRSEFANQHTNERSKYYGGPLSRGVKAGHPQIHTKILPLRAVTRITEEAHGSLNSFAGVAPLRAGYTDAVTALTLAHTGGIRVEPAVVAVPIVGASTVLRVSPDRTLTVPSVYIPLENGYTPTEDTDLKNYHLVPDAVFPWDRGFVVTDDALK